MNRKDRRRRQVEADSRKQPGKNSPIARLERMIQKTKQRIANLEGATNDNETAEVIYEEPAGEAPEGS